MSTNTTPRPTVAHFTKIYLGLTETWIYSQLINLKRYRPVVLTSGLENLEKFPIEPIYCYQMPIQGYQLWRIAVRKSYEFITQAQNRYFSKCILAEQAQLLHAHFGTEGYYQLGVQNKVDLPLVTTFYGVDASRFPKSYPKWRKRYKRLFEQGALFLAEGPFMAQALVDLGCPGDKVVVQHLGVDVEKIRYQPRHRQPGEPIRLLMSARFVEKKGFPYGIQAFIEAVRTIPELRLRIVGGAKIASEQRLLNECRAMVGQAGLTDKVEFLGFLSYQDYLAEFEAAHIFLAPSVQALNGDNEGGAPVSIIEATAAGLPVIATYHCDIPAVIKSEKNGLLVSERDVEALADAILTLAAHPEIWSAMGQFGRAHVEAEYDVFKQVARLEELYKKIIK